MSRAWTSCRRASAGVRSLRVAVALLALAGLLGAGGCQFFQNEFKDWKDFSGIHTLGGTFTSPASMGIKADSNVYQPVTVSRLAWWQVIGGVSSIAEMRSKYGWEAAGRTGTIQ